VHFNVKIFTGFWSQHIQYNHAYRIEIYQSQHRKFQNEEGEPFLKYIELEKISRIEDLYYHR
jgi:hypothetical protein